MESWLNYHHLYYFRTIANEGSIAKAAASLRLGQPTLSAQLKQLEDRLEMRLFDRQHKRMILTEQGRIALEYANEIFRMGSEMVQVLNDRLVPLKPHVQVGAQDSVPKSIISHLVQSAYRAGPCAVSILEGKDDELLRELLAHRIDLILTNRKPDDQGARKLHSRLLARIPVVVCASPRMKNLKELKKRFPRNLQQFPMVLPTAHSTLRHQLEHYFETHGISPDVLAETQDTSLQKTLGIEGVGLVIVNEVAAHNSLSRGDLVKVGVLQGVVEDLYLVAASRKIENPISGKLFRSFGVAGFEAS